MFFSCSQAEPNSGKFKGLSEESLLLVSLYSYFRKKVWDNVFMPVLKSNT